MVFGTHHLFRGNSTEFQWQTSFAMQCTSCHFPFPKMAEPDMCAVTAFWVTFAANSSADPRDHLGTIWPKMTPENQKIMIFGNETLGAASIAPVEVGEVFSGAC